MSDLQKPELGIGEDEVTGSAPFVRALLVQRLEKIWSQCEPHVDGTVKPDPRFIEAGIRVLDRLARLYRLDQPLTPVNVAVDDPRQAAVDQAKLILQELTSRMDQGGRNED